MHDDRRPSGDDHTTKETAPVTRGDGEKQQSAAQRRAGGADAATRDYAEKMTELDSAGTVDEQGGRGQKSKRELAADSGRRSDDVARGTAAGEAAHAAGNNGDRPAGAPADDDEKAHSVRGFVRDHALTLGLAASSIALLIGARGSGGKDATAEGTALPDVLTPPAHRAEEQGPRWDLHLSDHERVDFFVEYLMGKNHDKTRTWLERIGKYGPLIQNELRERGMPEDLLYLTMIESGLNPNAYSKAHAAGLWQFIKETGQRYGLEVSSYVDERRDPIKSTAAALDYLQQMHSRFDSWYLSAAGYNTGENRVGRLMRETVGSEKGSDDGYWQIWERLPAETRDYVPLMLAMGKIAKEPDKYGFHEIEYMQPLRFEEVIVPGGTKLAAVARAAGVDSGVIEDLNPHLVKKQTPPKRRVAVRVPVGQQHQVAAALSGEAVAAPVLAD